MTAITTFDLLKAAIAKDMARSDLTDILPRFVQFAEAEFNRRLRTLDMETTQTVSLASGTATASLESDFLKQKQIYSNDSIAPRKPRFMELSSMLSTYAGMTSGRPVAYAVGAGKTLHFAPTPDTAYSFTLLYFQKIPALSDSNTDNWLLLAHPDLYLAASLYHAFKYIRNEQMATHYHAIKEEIIQQIKDSDDEAREGAGSMQITVGGVTP